MPFHRFSQGKSALEKDWSVDTREMEPPDRLLGRCAAFALLLVAAIAVSVSPPAFGDDYKPGIVGIPLSDKFVAGEIHLANADKEVVKFIAREGSVVVLKGTDYHMAFSTRITPEGDVHLNYFNVTTIPGPEGGEAAQMFGCASAATGHFALPDADMAFDSASMPFDVRIILTGDHEFVSPFFTQNGPIDPEFLLRSKAGASCCARACDGTLICGCSVQTGCGGCCSGDCCGLGPLSREQLTRPIPEP